MIERPWQPAAVRVIGGVMLLFHAWVVLGLSERWSVTHNEVGHIPAGLACWYFEDYELYRVNPPIPRMIATIALLGAPGLQIEPPLLDSERPRDRMEFAVGTRFADLNALDYHALVRRARLAGVFWVTLGGFVAWRWAQSRFGPAAGLLVLALWTFEPTLTAHAALATPDVPATVAGLVATWVFDRSLKTTSLPPTCLAGFLLGIAFLCKFTILLLAPAWILASFFEKAATPSGRIGRFRARRVGRFLVIGVIAWITLNAGFGFRGTGSPLGDRVYRSKLFHKVFGPENEFWTARLPAPAPTAYISGIDLQQSDFEGGPRSYLRGTWRTGGWWYYYLYAFGVKTPLGHLAVYGLALAVVLFRRVSVPAALWVAPLLIVGCASWKSGYTEHLRYILPAYPFVMIASGVAVADGGRRGRVVLRILAAALVIGSGASMMRARPDLLGYFNELVGGPSEGWRQLADSNLDWGQDQIFLREWIQANPDRRPLFVDTLRFVDERLYLGRSHPEPRPDMNGFAVVDAFRLTGELGWLRRYPMVARIGTSLFVFEVRP